MRRTDGATENSALTLCVGSVSLLVWSLLVWLVNQLVLVWFGLHSLLVWFGLVFTSWSYWSRLYRFGS